MSSLCDAREQRGHVCWAGSSQLRYILNSAKTTYRPSRCFLAKAAVGQVPFPQESSGPASHPCSYMLGAGFSGPLSHSLSHNMVLRRWSDCFIAVHFLSLRAIPCLYLRFKSRYLAPGKGQRTVVQVSSMNGSRSPPWFESEILVRNSQVKLSRAQIELKFVSHKS